MTTGPTSWMPPAPMPPPPPQGGLFSSLDAGTSGGLFGRLASPVEHLDSGGYPAATPVPPRPNTLPVVRSNYSLLPVPGAPDWDAVPLRAPVSSAERPPELPSRSPSTASARSSSSDVPEILSDVTPDNDWILGADYAGVGHHHNPRAVYRKFPLPDETRKVFDKATTGLLPFYGWHSYDELHRLYNDAVEELMNSFMKERDISAEQMTPDHARAVLKTIAESEDPRIRVYRAMLRHMGRLYRLRSGARGNE